MKVLITGGAGFIGSHLADFLLKNKHEVVVFDNLSLGKKEFFQHNLQNKNYTFIKLDLLNSKKLTTTLPSDIDTVFHLAANSSIMKSAEDPIIDLENTTIATFNLLSAMKKKNVKKIFYLSGSGVYGDVNDTKTGETFGPLLPISMYGATKLSAEAMISAFVHLFDMKAWILRPANIIGPRATHGVIYDFIGQLQSKPKSLRILGDGTQSKSYLYVDDVINAIHLVWKKSKSDIQLFNLGTNSYITVTQIAQIILKSMKLTDTSITYGTGNRGWKGDVPIVRLNNSKINALGWKSAHTSKQAVQETVTSLISSL